MKKLILFFAILLCSQFNFGQGSDEIYERHVGTKLSGTYPMTVVGLQAAITSLESDSGVIFIAYPGFDTTGVGAIPINIHLRGWLYALPIAVPDTVHFLDESKITYGSNADIDADNANGKIILDSDSLGIRGNVKIDGNANINGNFASAGNTIFLGTTLGAWYLFTIQGDAWSFYTSDDIQWFSKQGKLSSNNLSIGFGDFANEFSNQGATHITIEPSFGNIILAADSVTFRRNVTIDSNATIKGDLGVRGNVDAGTISIDVSTLSYNTTEHVMQFTTGFAGVTNQVGLEDWTHVLNRTGSTIVDGSAVYFNGVDGDSINTIALATNVSEDITNRTVGLVTNTIADNGHGFVTSRGYVRDVNTIGLSVGTIYLGIDGSLTSTKPSFPAQILLMGQVIKVGTSDGVINVGLSRLYTSVAINKSYSFTSNGVSAGDYYTGGFYDSPATDVTLTNALLTQTYGVANVSYAAHAFIVCGGAGTVNTGVVGLRVTGTSIDDDGVRTTGDADTILTDITAVALNEYYEGIKFIGTMTFELIVMSGTPTVYSLDINYGYSKYDDFANKSFTLTDFEVVGTAGGTDAIFDVILSKHTSTGWTYSSSAFVAGNGEITSLSAVHGAERTTSSGIPFAFKRQGINQIIDGDLAEGIIVKIMTGNNNTVQYMDIHVGVIINP